MSYHFPYSLQAAAYEISDPSVLTPTALAYVRARNADPMCSFGDFAAISHIVDVATAMVCRFQMCYFLHIWECLMCTPFAAVKMLNTS